MRPIRERAGQVAGDIRLQARIALAVGAGALVVALGVALLLINTVALRSDAGQTIDTDTYLAAVTSIERLVVDAETGLRGYVITDRTLFLEPSNTTLAQFPQAVATLDRAAAREHAFVAQAHGLVQSATSYLTGYVPATRSLVAHDPAAARTVAVTLEGKHLVDAIRAQAEALQDAITVRQNARQRTARGSANSAVVEGVAVLVALTALTALLGAFLGRVALARDRARARSERTADILQRSLLPGGLPEVPGCEFAVRFRPAGQGELVGGDFYDVFAVGDRWAIVLGDVCGKGAEAAAVTAMARWTLRSYGEDEDDPAAPLRFLNASMLRQDLDGRFITIAYVLLSVERDRLHASVACAAHPAPIYVPASGEPVALDAWGDLLGMWPDVSLEVCQLELRPGDGLVVYTDGVTDQGPEIRAQAPTSALRNQVASASAEALASRLEGYADQHGGSRRDDVAILALRFRGQPGAAEAPCATPDSAAFVSAPAR